MKRQSMKETKQKVFAVADGLLFAVTPDGTMIREPNQNIPLERLYSKKELTIIANGKEKEFVS